MTSPQTLFRQPDMPTHYPKRALEILSEEGPVELAKSTRKFARKQVPFYYEIVYRNIISRVKYDVPIEPLKIYYVNPENIKYSVGYFSRKKRIGTVETGDWDKNRTEFTETTIYRGLYQRFVEGYDWENTQYYKSAKQQIERDGKKWGYSSAENFLKHRCTYIDNLYRNIKNNGYQPQATLKEKNIDNVRHNKPSNRHKKTHEIGCNIGRNGELLSNTGNHRLSIAKILNLEQIPFQIIVRHNKWQELRDEIHNNGLPEKHEDLRNHPDIQEILD